MASNNSQNINVPLLMEIMELQFTVLELVLYLNTHPEDRRALKNHNKYARRLSDLLEKYQNKYQPLVNEYPGADYPWNWINEPWPWEIDY